MTVAVAEMGDRTQLLTLVLVARFRRPWPIIAGIFLASVLNHGMAAIVGVWVGRFLTPFVLDALVGTSMVAMAVWALRTDDHEEEVSGTARSAFLTSLMSFFLAEMGDKTQLATVALAAGYANIVAVVAGTTTGMMLVNIPVVVLGKAFADRLPIKTIQYVSSLLFLALGILFLGRAALHWL